MKRAAHGRVHARFRGVLALLVTVVALLCVFGHAERGGPGLPSSVAERVHAPAFAEPSDGTAAPCGKKAIAEHSLQRAENPRHLFRALRPHHCTPIPHLPCHSAPGCCRVARLPRQ